MHAFFCEGKWELHVKKKSQYLYSTHICCLHLKHMCLTIKKIILKRGVAAGYFIE
jgi:hypothetical protein